MNRTTVKRVVGIGTVLALVAGLGLAATAAEAATPIASELPIGGSLGSTYRSSPEVAPQTRLAVPNATTPSVLGLDVSEFNGAISAAQWNNIASGKADGSPRKFAYVKATEATAASIPKSSRDLPANPQFASQFAGAKAAGLLAGAYHFAAPSLTTGKEQADWFVANGGDWVDDGKTLPPLLDLEDGATTECWKLTPSQMVTWIHSYADEILAKTGRNVAIYARANWWADCTANSTQFAGNPLFISSVATLTRGPGAIPSNWGTWNLWQYQLPPSGPTDPKPSPTTYDFDAFNGSFTSLKSLATAPTVTRVAGADRYDTSAQLSAESFASPVNVAYVASGRSYPDALAGGALAGRTKGPVLLVTPTGIPSETMAELTRLKPQKIVILGGTSVIASSVRSLLAPYTASRNIASVGRLAGVDRYDTSATIANQFGTSPTVAYLATGLNFPDALSGAAVAAEATGGPLLLVKPTGISGTVATALARLKPKKIVVIGGTSAVSASTMAQAKSYATTGSVTRFSGVNRYETSAIISARTVASRTDTVYVAVGTAFPDALSGAPVAGIGNSPVLLTPTTTILPVTARELMRLKPANIVVLGGTSAIDADVAAQLAGFPR